MQYRVGVFARIGPRHPVHGDGVRGNDELTLGVHRIGDALPPGDLFFGHQPGLADEAQAGGAGVGAPDMITPIEARWR